MKKIIIATVVFAAVGLTSCADNPFAFNGAVADCDDTEKAMNITMDWGQLKQYDSYFYNLAGHVPPIAHNVTNSFVQHASTDQLYSGSFVSGADFYCRVTVTSGCSRNGGSKYSKSYIWAPGGTALAIQVLKNEDTNITIEYYNSCENYGPNFTPTGVYYPYFVGIKTISKTATSAAVTMTYPSKNKPC